MVGKSKHLEFAITLTISIISKTVKETSCICHVFISIAPQYLESKGLIKNVSLQF